MYVWLKIQNLQLKQFLLIMGFYFLDVNEWQFIGKTARTLEFAISHDMYIRLYMSFALSVFNHIV